MEPSAFLPHTLVASLDFAGHGWSAPTALTRERAGYMIAKRVFDVVFALTLLLVLLPLILILATVVARTSPGPVLFRQTRVGRHGRLFTCYKFRTMVADAETRIRIDPALAALYAQQWKLVGDPRVTPLGRWLRKSSLDELPQLINILRGEMSVVGPRPVQPEEIHSHYGPAAETVLAVPPGLTGLWQVSGRSALSYEQRVALDLEYVARRGARLDLVVVMQTIPAVMMSKGAV